MTFPIAALRLIPDALLRELMSLRLSGPRARESLKTVLSVLVAVGAAAVLNLDDPSWAAFSGFQTMRGSLAETLPRGLMRIAGTIMGAVFGLLVAPGTADSPVLLMVFLFLVSWVGAFQSLTTKYSYAWLFFGLTAGMVVTEALAAPADVIHFAATRVAEVTVGTCACLLVASLLSDEAIETQAGIRAAIWCGSLRDFLGEDWLGKHWPLLTYTTRSALAVAFLPFVWRWFSIEDFSQTAVTSYVVMIVPSIVMQEHRQHAIFARMAHRTVGCLLGSIVALICIGLFGTGLPVTTLVLAAGVWIGYYVQTGPEEISYIGTQFALGLLITLVQGPAPITDITPGLERLLGIVIACAMLCMSMLVWPLADKDELAQQS
jgi:uncharacterized membrane protein YccC